MDDCEVCKPDPVPKYDGPGVPVPMVGTRHRMTCELLPRPTPEAEEELRKQLAEIRACERRAWQSAHTYIIGVGER